jgi:homoserine dehydrogenase
MDMKQVKLGLIGFGNVGQGLAQIVLERGEDYASRFGIQFLLVGIVDAMKGCVYDPHGLDIAQLLKKVETDGNFYGLQAEKSGWDALALIKESNADVMVELSYTNLTTGEPATTYILEALRRKKHVVTTNKGPAALHYDRLEQAARENGVQIGVEGTVMSGTPAIRLGRELLAGAGVQQVQGILNGTTNYILTQMEAGASYAEALAQAQALGYAEADPTGDVEGFDAAGKVVILARLLMGVKIGMNDVDRKGISHLTPADIISARAAGERWKLIGSLARTQKGIQAKVQPTRIPTSHPLAGVSGATNAITYTTDLLGEVTLVGPGAGRLATGYAVVEDILAIYR